jgi:HSP20 family protein
MTMTKDKTAIDIQQDTPAATGQAPEAWGPLAALRDEIDRLFDGFGTGFWHRPAETKLAFWPEMPTEWRLQPLAEFIDCDGEYRISVEVPGLAADDVDIRITDGVLTLRGEKLQEKRNEKAGYLLRERRYGSFHRSLPLPRSADPAGAAASLSNGVLTVTIPKTQDTSAKNRKIEVKAA